MFEPSFSLERARSVITPDRVAAMLAAKRNALDYYNSLAPEVLIGFDLSLAAHFLNRQWYRLAQQEMALMAGVSFGDHDGQSFIQFD